MQLSYDYAKDRALMCLRANYESHLRIQLEWQMKKKGGISRRVEHAHASQRCAACGVVDKKSRNGESFVCVSCGWCHHADKNAAKNILDNDCLHTEETGGQAHGNRGGTIAGVEVVTRREDHGSDGSGMNNSTGRLGPDNDDDNIGRSDRAPERASGHATERSVCTNFYSPLYCQTGIMPRATPSTATS